MARFIAGVVVLLSQSLMTVAQEIALTFDDAPTHDGPVFSGRERTDLILNHLKEGGVDQVAFFIVSNHIDDRGLERLRSYADAGHLLANHTHTHQHIHDLGVNQYLEDVETAHAMLRTMKGFQPWFRYPFLDEGRSVPVRDSVRAGLNRLGLSHGYVTVDNYDWYINALLRDAVRQEKKIDLEKLRSLYIDHIWNSIQFYDSIAQGTLERSPRHVLLLHENDLAAYFLGDLITHLKSKGWKIISPAEAYQDPIASKVPDVLFNGQGRVAAIAREKGMAAMALVQPSEDEAFLDALAAALGVFK